MDEPHGALVLTAYGQVDIDSDRELERDSQSPLPFLRTSKLTIADDALNAFAVQHCGIRRDRTALIDLMHGLADHMVYNPGATTVDTTAAEAFAGGGGVCQDHTHAFLACARSHLKLAVGLDYLDACPVRGMRRGGGAESMLARVQVTSLFQVQHQ
jgi:transglutaminase-like putative cysteine protease